jgi:two-component system, NtrC family, response regulator AtoC
MGDLPDGISGAAVRVRVSQFLRGNSQSKTTCASPPRSALGKLRALAASKGFELPALGTGPAIRRLIDALLLIAPTAATVLLRGETGCGKGFIANLIHRLSPRSGDPFVQLVVGTLVPTLLESELFGHERGAFTGAMATKVGRFELAVNGTIFLDEIADVEIGTQGKLLRVLEERAFERVGGTRTLKASARVVVATNRDLKGLVDAGGFRADLYHRLNVVVVDVPPLRERRDDIPDLARGFVVEFGKAHRGYVPTLSPQALATLRDHPWPGNVRELRNLVERLVVQDRRGRIGVGDLPAEMRNRGPRARVGRGAPSAEVEVETLRDALDACGGNRKAAAALLGISRYHFYRLLGKHSL